MRMILAGLLATLVLGPTLSADDKKDEKIDAKKLIGKWEPKEKKEGASFVIEFLKDGKATFTINRDGKETKLDGTYKVDGNKLTTAMKIGEMERTRTLVVKKLTDTELVATDDKEGKENTLVRIKGK